jgi:hypothetical protein
VELENDTRNQTWATAAYLRTPRTVRYPTVLSNMRSCVIAEARDKEAELTESRPSRRATDDRPGYFRTSQNVQRTMIAHAVATSQVDRDYPGRRSSSRPIGAGPQSDQHHRDGYGDAHSPQAQHPVHVHLGARRRRRGHRPRPHALPQPRRLVLRHDDGLPVEALPEQLPRGLQEHLADRGGLLQLALGVGALRVHPAADDAGQDGPIWVPPWAGGRLQPDADPHRRQVRPGQRHRDVFAGGHRLRQRLQRSYAADERQPHGGVGRRPTFRRLGGACSGTGPAT